MSRLQSRAKRWTAQTGTHPCLEQDNGQVTSIVGAQGEEPMEDQCLFPDTIICLMIHKLLRAWILAGRREEGKEESRGFLSIEPRDTLWSKPEMTELPGIGKISFSTTA